VATGVPRSSVTAPAPTATVSTPQRSFELVLSTGERYLVSGQAVLGRSPAPVDPAVQALPIDDTTKSVSRAHVRLRVVSGTLYVTDVGSANGSAIERVGRRTACPPDVEFELRAGDRLWLGEVACDVLLA
jgi:predicted component of type VI protein secretion system